MTIMSHELGDLEKEYMRMAEDGNVTAVRYAMEESVFFNCTVVATVAAILKDAMPGHKLLLEVLAEHAAPSWARKEHEKRVKSTGEMVDEWAGNLESMS